MPNCPQCNSQHVVKNGHIHNGKQRFKCYQCGRQFVENPSKIKISEETKALIDQPKAGAARSLVTRENLFSRDCQSGSGLRKMVTRLC